MHKASLGNFLLFFISVDDTIIMVQIPHYMPLTAYKTTLELTHQAHSSMLIFTRKGLYINSTVLGTLEEVIYGQRITERHY